MNRFATLVLIGLAGLLAGCGSSVTSSTKPPTNVTYSMNVTPVRLPLDVGDHAGISAVVDESTLNSTPKPVSPPPQVVFLSSDPLVSVAPSGQVCAGQWDVKFVLCTPGPNIPVNPVIVTAYDNVHNVSGSTQIYVHPRAANITLCAPTTPGGTTTEVSCGTRIAKGLYPSTTNCVSQNQSVTYFASAYDSTGTLIPSCSTSPSTPGCISDQDYTWSTGDSTVASAGLYGGVVASNPGVTSVYAKLNGTVSVPMSFATCPPAGIVLQSSAYIKGAPAAPFSTADLNLVKGSSQYLTTTNFVDINGSAMTLYSLPQTFLSSDLLTGGFASVDTFTSRFTANTSGLTNLSTGCTPPACNPSISDFVSPTGQLITAKSMGYGYPIYSNLIGATVAGTTGSTVLVTGTQFANGAPSHQLLTYDSESMALTHTIEVANLPNSLVVAPNGARAYVGSDDGLVVVNLSNFESAILTYPIVGDPVNTDQITGTVLAVSPDSRYVVISDTNKASGNPNYQVVFLVDTTVAKSATRYAIGDNIRTATFATDGFDFWIGGDNGVYVYQNDTFVKTQNNQSSSVTSVAWALDGQSYFASGNGSLDHYSTCDDALLAKDLGTGPIKLASTAINGVPHVVGLATTPKQWFDYPVTSSSQAGNSTPVGNVCLSKVTVQTPVATDSHLNCAPQQFSFSPILERDFVSGVDPNCSTGDAAIYGYDIAQGAATGNGEITLTLSTTSTPTFTPQPTIVPLSGGVLNDGRKLYIGTVDNTNSALLRRFDLASGTEDVVPIYDSSNPPKIIGNSTPVSVPIIPSFVAVVPK